MVKIQPPLEELGLVECVPTSPPWGSHPMRIPGKLPGSIIGASYIGSSLVSMLEKVFGSFSPSQVTPEEGRSWASYTLDVVGSQAHFYTHHSLYQQVALTSLSALPENTMNSSLSSTQDFSEFHPLLCQ